MTLDLAEAETETETKEKAMDSKAKDLKHSIITELNQLSALKEKDSVEATNTLSIDPKSVN